MRKKIVFDNEEFVEFIVHLNDFIIETKLDVNFFGHKLIVENYYTAKLAEVQCEIIDLNLPKAFDIITEIEEWNADNAVELRVNEVYNLLESKMMELRKALGDE
jgi:hypothetical protein